MYSRYMVCNTLEKQNEIINAFLDVIETNNRINRF